MGSDHIIKDVNIEPEQAMVGITYRPMAQLQLDGHEEVEDELTSVVNSTTNNIVSLTKGRNLLMKRFLWHGGSVFDAWFSCASNQVSVEDIHVSQRIMLL